MTTENEIDITKLPQPPEGSVFSLSKVKKLTQPDAYCIKPSHIAYASKHFGGILKFAEHETLNLLFITVPQNRDLKSVAGLEPNS